MEKINGFNKENSISESTKLIRNMFDNNFTKKQMDLIYAVISLIKPSDEDFKTYQISYKDIGEIFNPANPDCTITVNDIDKAIKGIVNKSFRMENDNTITYYSYVSKAKIYKKEKYIEFQLDNDVQQFYLQLKTGEFTSYLLKDILALSTTFQMNLFRWLSCNSGFDNKIKIKIEDAAIHFYGQPIQNGDLVKKIDRALKVINKKTCINAEYKKIKIGKSHTIQALEFSIINNYKKPQKKVKTEAEIKANKEKNKAMWQELLELKEENIRLKQQLKKERSDTNEDK